MPINLFNLFDSFSTDPWSLILGPVILDPRFIFFQDVWTSCWRAPEDKHNDKAMITSYQLKTNANARLNNMAASDTLLRGHSVCWDETATGPLGGFSIQGAFLEVRKLLIF